MEQVPGYGEMHKILEKDVAGLSGVEKTLPAIAEDVSHPAGRTNCWASSRLWSICLFTRLEETSLVPAGFLTS